LNDFSHIKGYHIDSLITYLIASETPLHYFPHYNFLTNIIPQAQCANTLAHLSIQYFTQTALLFL